MILNHVWDQSFEGVTNIVDVYVRYLRRKIDEPFPVKLIHTVRGVGYCVRETEPEQHAATGMNHRSLPFRLGAWYTLLLSATFILVGAGDFLRSAALPESRICAIH